MQVPIILDKKLFSWTFKRFSFIFFFLILPFLCVTLCIVKSGLNPQTIIATTATIV